MLVFGVTGTNGKTTISYLLKSIVNAWGKECGVLGTIAYVYGGQSFESVNTTPESFELQRMFDEMHRRYGTDVLRHGGFLATLSRCRGRMISLLTAAFLRI